MVPDTASGATSLPPEWTPLNLQAYLCNAFGACGCSDIAAMRATLLRLLEWHASEKMTRCEDLYPDVGIFYLLAGQLDALGFAEHGISIRGPWLT